MPLFHIKTESLGLSLIGTLFSFLFLFIFHNQKFVRFLKFFLFPRFYATWSEKQSIHSKSACFYDSFLNKNYIQTKKKLVKQIIEQDTRDLMQLGIYSTHPILLCHNKFLVARSFVVILGRYNIAIEKHFITGHPGYGI